MFKKLVLLIVGGAAAAGGFYYYTNLPEEQSAAIMQTLKEQKVNLEQVAEDIAQSEPVQKAITKGKEHLMNSPQARQWLTKMVQGYSQEFQDTELDQQASEEVVDVLLQVRKFSENALQVQDAGGDPYSAEQQAEFQKIMEEGDAVMQQHLGVTLTEFLAKINKSSFQQLVDP